MTIHERITTDMLDMYDKGTFKRENLEYLAKELLRGDELYDSLYHDYSRLQEESYDKDVIIKFLKKEIIKKTSFRLLMKRQYKELRQKYEALLQKQNPYDNRFENFVKGVNSDK